MFVFAVRVMYRVRISFRVRVFLGVMLRVRDQFQVLFGF